MYKLTENKEYVKDLSFINGSRVINIELEEYKQWLSEGNTPEPEFTQAELAQQVKDKAIQEALAYLASTDWITSKYNDVVTVLGTMSKADFVAKYKEIYDNRTAARAVVGGE